MESGQQVGLWVHDRDAKLFLGLPADHPTSRWVVVGTIQQYDNPIGVWLDVAYIEERRPEPGAGLKRVHYGVKPGQCLIRWEYIITAQLLKDVEIPVDTRPDPGLYL